MKRFLLVEQNSEPSRAQLFWEICARAKLAFSWSHNYESHIQSSWERECRQREKTHKTGFDSRTKFSTKLELSFERNMGTAMKCKKRAASPRWKRGEKQVKQKLDQLRAVSIIVVQIFTSSLPPRQFGSIESITDEYADSEGRLLLEVDAKWKSSRTVECYWIL